MIRPTKSSHKILQNLKQHDKLFKEGIVDGLHEVGKIVVKENQRLIIEGPKTGRVYRIKGRPHQASAPGEAPANLSGRLKESADYEVHNEEKLEVGERAPYAKFLEDGTKNMAPRPHLIKAIKNKQRETQRALQDKVEEKLC